VRCLDEHGKLRVFPITITDLNEPTDFKRLAGSSGIVSLDDLVSLKELVAALITPLRV